MMGSFLLTAIIRLAIYCVCLSVSTKVCYIYFISIPEFILSVGIITCSPVCTFIVTYVCTKPQVWSVHFSVSQIYYINIFSILMIIISLRLSACLSCPFFRQSACYPPSPPMFIIFIHSSVRIFASSGEMIRRIQFRLISFWQSTNLYGPVGVVPLWIRKVSVSNLGLKTGHQWPYFPKISCC